MSALEDFYGIRIGEINGEACLRLDKFKGTTYLSMFDIFHAWNEQAVKLKNGEITEDEYNDWRYNYPKTEVERTKAALDSRRKQRKEHNDNGDL